MSLIVRKEIDCLRGRHLVVVDGWDGETESVVLQVIGARGAMRIVCNMEREDAADLGRALVELYGGG